MKLFCDDKTAAGSKLDLAISGMSVKLDSETMVP